MSIKEVKLAPLVEGRTPVTGNCFAFAHVLRESDAPVMLRFLQEWSGQTQEGASGYWGIH